MELDFDYLRSTYEDQKILDQAKALDGRSLLLVIHTLTKGRYKVIDLWCELDYLP